MWLVVLVGVGGSGWSFVGVSRRVKATGGEWE